MNKKARRSREERRQYGMAQYAKWTKRHPRPADWAVKRETIPDTTATLKCRNEFFEGWITWRRKAGVWVFHEASPSMVWAAGTHPDKVKIELLRKGCDWEWA